MKSTTRCLIFVTALSLSHGRKVFDHAILERSTGKWTNQFDPNEVFESGTCSRDGRPISTYACRQIWGPGQTNTLIGRYAPEYGSCIVTDLDGNSVAKTQDTEFLLIEPDKDYWWKPIQNGLFDKYLHQYLLIGSAYDYKNQYICRFDFDRESDGETYIFQGSVVAGDSLCRTGWHDDSGKLIQVSSNKFEILSAK